MDKHIERLVKKNFFPQIIILKIEKLSKKILYLIHTLNQFF